MRSVQRDADVHVVVDVVAEERTGREKMNSFFCFKAGLVF
jgi:hypothetical protein